MRKYLITGATGFIGKYLINKLLQNDDVSLIATYRNKKDIFQEKKVTWIKFDLFESTSNLYEFFDCPEILIHLAWGNLPNYLDSYHNEVELPAQKKFIENIVSEKLKNIFVLGSCFEYGMKEGEYIETAEVNPENSYAKAKVSLYKYIIELKKKHEFSLTWGRLFYVYGKGQAKHTLYSQFLEAASKNIPFKMSPGDQRRDFLDIEEAVDHISRLVKSHEDNGIVNICSGKGIKIKNLVESWKKDIKSNIKLDLGYYDYPEIEPMNFWGSNKKLKNLVHKTKK